MNANFFINIIFGACIIQVVFIWASNCNIKGPKRTSYLNKILHKRRTMKTTEWFNMIA